jgi:hypothetical protein
MTTKERGEFIKKKQTNKSINRTEQNRPTLNVSNLRLTEVQKKWYMFLKCKEKLDMKPEVGKE